LLAVEWILLDEEIPAPNLFHTLNLSNKNYNRIVNNRPDRSLDKAGYSDAVEGLTGLITLGAAWESVDIFNALTFALSDQGDGVIGELCLLRVEELIEFGHSSISPHFVTCNSVGPPNSYVDSSITPYYKKAREESDQWSQLRNEYITAKLQIGSHPDTNPEFWDDWKETTSPPRYPLSIRGFLNKKPVLAAIVIVTGILVLYVLRMQKTKQPDPV